MVVLSMKNFEEAEFEEWFYNNFFDGPLCVMIEGQRITIGGIEEEVK
jgi:hypothetical protein